MAWGEMARFNVRWNRGRDRVTFADGTRFNQFTGISAGDAIASSSCQWTAPGRCQLSSTVQNALK